MNKWIAPWVVLVVLLILALPTVVGAANEPGPLSTEAQLQFSCDWGIDIRKQVEGPDSRTFSSGSNVEFVIVVTNICDGDLENVTVSDPLAPDRDSVIGDLTSGASVNYSCTAQNVTAGFTNVAEVTATFTNVFGESGNRSDSDPSTVVIEDGETGDGEGCTPGFWRNHLDDWPTRFAPGDDFDTIFGVNLFNPDITLEQAVNLGGGGVKKLARHGTAALLSAAHPNVDYPLSLDQVIAVVQAGDADTLAAANELGCDVNN
jgi:uncharacterized repeat protein (TIGR01451 family)